MRIEINHISEKQFRAFLNLTKSHFPRNITLVLNTNGGNLETARNWADIISQYNNHGSIFAVAQNVKSSGIYLLNNAKVVLSPKSIVQFHYPESRKNKLKRDFLTKQFIQDCQINMGLNERQIREYMRTRSFLTFDELIKIFPSAAIKA